MKYKQLQEKISNLCEFLGVGYHETPKVGLCVKHYHMRQEDEPPLVAIQYNGDDHDYEWNNYVLQIRGNILRRINLLKQNIESLEKLREEILNWDKDK